MYTHIDIHPHVHIFTRIYLYTNTYMHIVFEEFSILGMFDSTEQALRVRLFYLWVFQDFVSVV